MKRNKVILVFLVALLIIYPLYSLAEEADKSPNIILGRSLVQSDSDEAQNKPLGESGAPSLGSSGQDKGVAFLEKYNIQAPDRKIPFDSDFDLFYGILVSDFDDTIMDSTIEILDDDGFDPSTVGDYAIKYQVEVDKLSETFSRVITVTPYRAQMNDLVIVKETEDSDDSTQQADVEDKYAEIDELFTGTPEENSVESDPSIIEGEYYVTVADASIFEDPSVLDSLKKTRVEDSSIDTLATAQEEPEDIDILSTHSDGENLAPLDLRYGIKVLNSKDENIAEYLTVVNDDDFSMEENEPKQYDVDYAIVYKDGVVVELNREVSVLGNTRASATSISEMVINQSIVDSTGKTVSQTATWGTDGNLVVLIDGKRQYASGTSGTVLRFLDEPLQVVEDKENGGTVTHQVVGENLHSFVGHYVQNFYNPRNNLAMFPFTTISGETVQRRGFIGADDNSKRSSILADGEVNLRNIISNANLVEEFDVFNQIDDSANLSMTRKYKYFPNRYLLNKTTSGQVLNNKPLFELEVTVRFVPGELKLLREVTITNLGYDYRNATGETPVFRGHLMYMADTMFEGNDYGFAFRDEIDDSVYVRGVEDGARTMLLKGNQSSEASFAGNWHFAESLPPHELPPNFVSRYIDVYGQRWFDEVDANNATLTGLLPYTTSGGALTSIKHTASPHYNMNVRTAAEGELPKNLNSMAYPVTKTLFSTDIPGKSPTSKSHINGSIDTSYAMQWALPPTAVGESHTFVVEEDWLEAADLQIVAPKPTTITAGDSETLRFTAENTHMYDHAMPGAQVWDLNSDFTLVSEGIDGVTSWPATIEKVYKNEGGSLVEVPFTGTTGTTLIVNAGEKLYFDVKVTVNEKALGGHKNKLTLQAKVTNTEGHTSESYDSMVVTADSLAVITSVTAQTVAANAVTAKVEFNNPSLTNPQDPTVLYNTTVKLYDSSNRYITEVTGKIPAGGILTLTGLTLVEGESYKLVATAEPEAKGTVETTFVMSSEEASITYAQAPSYAIITGMPSPLVRTAPYAGGSANFTLDSTPPTAVGLLFAGWKDTETSLVHPAGSTFSMLLTEIRRDATLQTTWTVDPNYKITVTFDSNGGTGTAASQIKYVGEKIDLPTENVIKIGYKLAGWTTVKDDSTKAWDFSTILTGNPQAITLYANWELDPASWRVTITETPNFSFETRMISSTSQEVPLQAKGVLKIRDTYPGTGSDWTLSVSASQFSTVAGETLNKGALQYYDAAGIGKSVYHNPGLGEGSALNIWTETSSSTQFDYERDFDIILKESFGVALMPAEGLVAAYNATVTWALISAP